VFLELTDLKFDAALLCYKAIKMAMKMAPDGEPHLVDAFFMTDAFMNLD